MKFLRKPSSVTAPEPSLPPPPVRCGHPRRRVLCPCRRQVERHPVDPRHPGGRFALVLWRQGLHQLAGGLRSQGAFHLVLCAGGPIRRTHVQLVICADPRLPYVPPWVMNQFMKNLVFLFLPALRRQVRCFRGGGGAGAGEMPAHPDTKFDFLLSIFLIVLS